MKLETRVHVRLAAGQTAYGGWSVLNSPFALELMANGTDFDFIGVDLQHAAMGVGDSTHLLRAMQAAQPEVTPFVRLATQDKYWIEQSLDAGFTGLIVPLVESAEQARALVRAAYYPPRGARSQAGTLRATLYENYFDTIDDRLFLLPQIESRDGLEHCEEIINVPGVSGALFGPGDLGLSCGWSGKDSWSFQPFVEAVRRVVGACTEAGKIPAVMMAGLDNAARARDAGFRLIAFIHDGADIRIDAASQRQSALDTLRSPPA